MSKRGPKPKAVQTAKVERQDLQAKVSANGKVQATKKVDLSATVPGQVIHLAVREGDFVKKGQFLMQLDAVNYRAGAKSSEFSMQALLKDLDSARFNAGSGQGGSRARREEQRGRDPRRGRRAARADQRVDVAGAPYSPRSSASSRPARCWRARRTRFRRRPSSRRWTAS